MLKRTIEELIVIIIIIMIVITPIIIGLYCILNVKYEYIAIDGTIGTTTYNKINTTNFYVKLDDDRVIKIIEYKKLK